MPSLKQKLKRTVESALDIAIYSTAPHGRDDCRDLLASRVPIRRVLDVGANDGSSALKFHEAFPEATIDSFEPVSATFDTLRHAAAAHPRIRCHKLAMGDRPGSASIYLHHHPSMHSLAHADHAQGQETIEITTVDAFMTAQQIDAVDLLKIDTEGYDLKVLEGAKAMLAAGRIRFVLVEVGFHRGDDRFVLFDDVRDTLAAHDFSLYGIYDQQLEWSGENRLQYANACFAHRHVLNARGR